jgi:hypothetical protein
MATRHALREWIPASAGMTMEGVGGPYAGGR